MTGVPFIDQVIGGIFGLVAAPMLLEVGLGWFWAGTREASE